jgi:hypothetical protein
LLGIPLLPLATTAAILISEPVETREITLKCDYDLIVRFNPAIRVTYSGGFRGFRSHAAGDVNYIVFQTDSGARMRIDWETMAYSLTRTDFTGRDGGDLAGWQRLIHAYAVLGRDQDARQAPEDARRRFYADARALGELAALAKSLGLGS